MSRLDIVMNMYQAMLDSLGPSRWWPGDTPFEVAVGAILTQNTNWGNVEKAIANLKAADALAPRAMAALPRERLSELIRPAGYFRVKADRLGNFLDFLQAFPDGGQETALAALAQKARNDPETLRTKLLEVKGIGPETADSILLYALGTPSFVADAYTRRILARHGLLPEDVPYDEVRDFFMDVLPLEAAMFNEYHALIVRVGKNWCKKRNPDCEHCPLSNFLD